MLKSKPPNIFFLLVPILLLVASACTIEYKMARHYVKNVERPNVLYIAPDYIFKTNLKSDEIASSGTLNQFVKDSLLFYRSQYLQYLDDSLVLAQFNNAYIAELKALGINVYTEQEMDAFLAKEDASFIINIAQMEFEEYNIPYRDEESFDMVVYYREIDLNAVGLNSWFEISRMNHNEDPVVLFASHYVIDEYEGTFKFYPFTGEISHHYSVDTIAVDDVYDLVSFLGQKYAGYTFDFLMNIYIYNNAPENVNLQLYYHYDRKRNTFVPVDDDRFVPLD